MNGSSFNRTGTPWPDMTPFDVIWFRTLLILGYIFVFVTSVVGNLLVIVVIFCHRQMRTAVNFFLANLAIADLSVGIFCVLSNLFKYMSQYWVMGKVMCKMQKFVESMNYTCSIIILTVISLERFAVIKYPMWNKRFQPTWFIRFVVIVVVWTASIAYSIPLFLSYDIHSVVDRLNQTRNFCLRSHMMISLDTYARIDFTLLYVLPLLVMTAVYVNISIILWRSGNVTASFSPEGSGDGPSNHPDPLIKKFDGAARCWRRPAGCCRGLLTEGSLERRKLRSNPELETIGLQKVAGRSGEVREPRKHHDSGGVTALTQLRDGGPGHESEPCLLDEAHHNDLLLITIQRDLRRREPMTSLSHHPNCGHKKMDVMMSSIADGGGKGGGRGRVGVGGASNSVSLKPFKPILIRKWHLANATSNNSYKQSVNLYNSAGSMASKRNPPPTRATAASLVQLKRRKVIRLLMVIIISFAVCLLPHHIRLQYQQWHPKASNLYRQMFMPPITTLFFYMNSSINPIIYAFISKKFRRAIATLDWCALWKKIIRLNRGSNSLSSSK